MLAVALGAPSLAGAATCAPAPDRAKLDAADAAFVGRLTGTEPVPGQPGNLDYVFTVDQVVKGDLPRTLTVRSGVGPDELGFSLERDTATGILLNRDRGLWFGGRCGQISVGALAQATREENVRLVNWGGVLLGTLVVVTGLVLLLRKARRRQQGLRREL